MRDRFRMPDSDPHLEALKAVVDYAADRLEDMAKQRERLDTRTALIVTSSGGLITVVGILGALLPRREGDEYSAGLLAAVVVAQISALLTGGARHFLDVRSAVATADDSADAALRLVAEFNNDLAKFVAEQNWRRVRQLRIAVMPRLLESSSWAAL